jgi:filamentous hemagglutinin
LLFSRFVPEFSSVVHVVPFPFFFLFLSPFARVNLMRRLSLLGLGLFFAVSAQAQILADPSAPGGNRPVVLEAGKGVPLVNITTPTAGGVSMNAYRQFDIQNQGAILNNNRSPQVMTELGGYVTANPSLLGSEARVIVNQVNSASPSYLGGPLEIAGGERNW